MAAPITACGALTRAGSPCRRGCVPGRTRCKLHGGASTGPRTTAAKARLAARSMTHGLYSRYLRKRDVEPEDPERSKPDLGRELVLVRTVLEDALDALDGALDAKARAVVLGAIDGLVGRVTRIVEGAAPAAGQVTMNTLNVTLGSLSTAELETVVRVLGDPTLAPLQRLLVPLLDSGQLLAGRAVAQAPEHATVESPEHGSTVQRNEIDGYAPNREHDTEHEDLSGGADTSAAAGQ